MADQALKPQTALRDFAVKRVLGRGSFGITYLAERQEDHVAVAIKEYFPADIAERNADGTTVNPSRPSSDAGQDFHSGLEKFLEESRVLGGFENPYIVRVVDTFELNGTAYMVMQYEEGGTLARYLHAHDKPLEEGQILAIFVPVLEGLKDIHAKWLLHRDIKPENIYIRKDGSPLLIDFGTARHALSAKHGGMTEYLTPGFAPPEQYDRQDDHGPWTDIYAVGATMYYCVTRIVPAEGRRRLAKEDPVMPAVQAAPAIYDRGMLEVIDWMMTPDAKQRPQSVDEVLQRLQALQARETEAVDEGQEELAETMTRAARNDGSPVSSDPAVQPGTAPRQEPAAPANTDAEVTAARAQEDRTEKPDAEAQAPSSPPPPPPPRRPRAGNRRRTAGSGSSTGASARRSGKGLWWAGSLALAGLAIFLVVRPAPEVTSVPSIEACQSHLDANRLNGSATDDAYDCYQEVLAAEPGNPSALAGLREIADAHAARSREGIEAGDLGRARESLKKLKEVGPDHEAIEDLETAVAGLERQHEPAEPAQASDDEEVFTRLPRITGLGSYHALVIGNSDYQELPALATPVNDSRAVSDMLKSAYGYETRLLLDASRYDILAALNDYRKNLGKSDNLLIYYSGHGEIDTVTDVGYWLPVDAGDDNTANWISTSSISEILNVMAARHVLVVADSVYSGALTRSGLARLQTGKTEDEWVKWFEKVSQLRTRMVMSSGGEAPVDTGGEHSLFARAFLDALEENQSVVDGYRLFLFVSDRVKAAIRQRSLDEAPTPEYAPIRYAGHEAGEFFFQRR